MENTKDPQNPQCCFKICNNNTEEAKTIPTIKSFQQKEPTAEASKNVFGIFDDMLFYY